MITKQELIDIMKEGWQQTGYYSVNFNANMVADKILERIKKDLEILETFRKILKENHNAQRIDNCVFAKSDTETYFGLGDDAIIVKNEDVEKIEHWFYRGE